MLLKYYQDVPDPEKLKDVIKYAGVLGIFRWENETDADYAERAVKIGRLAAEIPKLFEDGTWTTGSVIDAITVGLASIVTTSYRDKDAALMDPLVATLVADRIRAYRTIESQDPPAEVTDDFVREFIKEYQLIDRPSDSDEPEKLRYARRVIGAIRMIESSMVATGITEFDAIEALCAELTIVFKKSPLPINVIEDLIKRIPENIKRLKDEEDI